MSEGDLDGSDVVCPCHLGTFDVTSGRVLSGPPTSGLRTSTVIASASGLELA